MAERTIMASVDRRYDDGVRYIRRTIQIVEDGPPWYEKVSGIVEWYAGKQKTLTARQDLERIEKAWWFAKSEAERAKVARDAEMLADRVQESLPGALQEVFGDFRHSMRLREVSGARTARD